MRDPGSSFQAIVIGMLWVFPSRPHSGCWGFGHHTLDTVVASERKGTVLPVCFSLEMEDSYLERCTRSLPLPFPPPRWPELHHMGLAKLAIVQGTESTQTDLGQSSLSLGRVGVAFSEHIRGRWARKRRGAGGRRECCWAGRPGAGPRESMVQVYPALPKFALCTSHFWKTHVSTCFPWSRKIRRRLTFRRKCKKWKCSAWFTGALTEACAPSRERAPPSSFPGVGAVSTCALSWFILCIR